MSDTSEDSVLQELEAFEAEQESWSFCHPDDAVPTGSHIGDALNNIPSFLFRVYGPDSKGQTNTYHVISPAWVHSGETEFPPRLWALPRQEAAEMVNDHLWWNCGRDCNLMSWSSSLLFVIQFGLFLAEKYRISLSDLKLVVVDTRGMERGSFIRDLGLIREFYRDTNESCGDDTLTTLKRLREGNYYFGEYLTQGWIDLREQCAETTMADLLSPEFYRLAPCFRDTTNRTGWANPVRKFRGIIEQGRYPLTRGDVGDAMSLTASCFGEERWIPAVFPQLLSMSSRYPNLRTFSWAGEMDIARVASLFQDVAFGPEADFAAVPELRLTREIVTGISATRSEQVPEDSGVADLGSDDELVVTGLAGLGLE
ncbi:hypothetical protein OQA88_13435 [Cercophora sp. LCS_1]